MAGVIPILFGLDLNDMVTMQLVPLGIVMIVGSLFTMNVPSRFAKEWRESGIKISPTVYKVLNVLAIIASAILVIYCFLSNGYKIVTLIITAGIFLYGCLRNKYGHIEIQSHKEYVEGAAE